MLVPEGREVLVPEEQLVPDAMEKLVPEGKKVLVSVVLVLELRFELVPK